MTQAPATPELVERLNEMASMPFTRFHYADDAVMVKQAADALEAQQARIAELEADLKAALREVVKHAREAGEAIGRLEMSEAAGIVDGWRERSDRYEKALRAQDDAERRDEQHQELIARSDGEGWDEVTGGSHLNDDWKHVAAAYAKARELRVQALSSSQGRHEGEQDSSSRSQPCADAQERSPGSLHSGGIDDDCPHAGTFRYCAECPVSPCPLGLGRGDNQ